MFGLFLFLFLVFVLLYFFRVIFYIGVLFVWYVFVFEFASVLQWLSKEYAEPRMADFAEVISTSMRQLLPYEGHLCGIAKSGFYPEVVQHTNWDYGKNGKGYYNDIFAPGWTVASLWELLTPGRAERFLLD